MHIPLPHPETLSLNTRHVLSNTCLRTYFRPLASSFRISGKSTSPPAVCRIARLHDAANFPFGSSANTFATSNNLLVRTIAVPFLFAALIHLAVNCVSGLSEGRVRRYAFPNKTPFAGSEISSRSRSSRTLTSSCLILSMDIALLSRPSASPIHRPSLHSNTTSNSESELRYLLAVNPINLMASRIADSNSCPCPNSNFFSDPASSKRSWISPLDFSAPISWTGREEVLQTTRLPASSSSRHPVPMPAPESSPAAA